MATENDRLTFNFKSPCTGAQLDLPSRQHSGFNGYSKEAKEGQVLFAVCTVLYDGSHNKAFQPLRCVHRASSTGSDWQLRKSAPLSYACWHCCWSSVAGVSHTLHICHHSTQHELLLPSCIAYGVFRLTVTCLLLHSRTRRHKHVHCTMHFVHPSVCCVLFCAMLLTTPTSCPRSAV